LSWPMAMGALPAVGVLRFDQGVPVLNPEVAEHRPHLPGPVLLPADGDAFGCQVKPGSDG
jgi:hypothetical protein